MTAAALAIRFDVVAIGVMAGLGYAVLAAGIVLVYRATRIINLAHGQVGAFSAVVLVELVQAGLPYPVAFAGALATGAAIAALVERGLVRPLLARSRLAVLVGTIGVSQLLIVAQAQLPKVIGQRFPVPVDWDADIGSLALHGEHFTIVLLAPIVIVGFALFLSRSRYGLAIRGVADNRDAAELAGVSSHRVSLLVWVLAGGLAAMASILTLPLSGTTFGSGAMLALGPSLLLRALAAGLAGRLEDLNRTIVAGVAIGVVEAVLFASFPDDLGAVDLVLFLAVLAMLLLQRDMRRTGTADTEGFGEEPPAVPERIRTHPAVRRVRVAGMATAIVVALGAPLVYSSSSDLYLLARVPVFAIIGVSVVVLTGWAGQLSLCQVAFVGVGAMGTAALNSRGVPFGAAMAYAVIAGTLVAVVIGAPALRLRGLLLTVTTLGFAVAASSFVLTRDLFRSSDVDVAMVSPGAIGPLDFDSFRTSYYLCLGALAAVSLASRRLRATGVARRMIAVEGNERSAEAMTVSPATTKLSAFALSGAFATLAGGLLAGVSRTFQVDLFAPDQSLQVLAMTVVGGVGSVAGAIIGAVYLVGVPNLFGDSATARLATSGIGLLVILRVEPAGLLGLLHRPRDVLYARLVRAPSPASGSAPAADARPSAARLLQRQAARDGVPSTAEQGAPALAAQGVTVVLGGRTIVAGVDLTIRRDEIVGLIGANGAGKSTLMDALSGFTPATGTIAMGGDQIELLSATSRARHGLGRSFQTARLYPRLTVRETVQVALEAQRRSELLPSLLALPPSVVDERWSRAAADDVLDLLGLGDRAEQLTAALSTGTRRVVEFACLLAMRPSVVLLDEPMAGIAQRETEAFAPLLLAVREELGAAMLVIEHDLPLVSSICSRLYCLESGVVIAEGAPSIVRDDPRVIASYLGTDERAIARSGAVSGDVARPPHPHRARPLTVGDRR